MGAWVARRFAVEGCTVWVLFGDFEGRLIDGLVCEQNTF